MWLWTNYTKCQKPKGLHNAGKRLWMNVIHTSCLHKSVDLRGISYSFSSVLHEWLKTGHKSFTAHQNSSLWHFSVPAWWDQEHSKDCCPSITQQAQVENTALFTGCLCIPASEAARKTQARSRQQNPSPLFSRAGILEPWRASRSYGDLLKHLSLAELMSSVHLA